MAPKPRKMRAFFWVKLRATNSLAKKLGMYKLSKNVDVIVYKSLGEAI